MAESSVESIARPATSHRSASERRERTLVPKRLFNVVVLHRLFETFPNVIGQVDEFGIAPHRFGDTRPRQRHVENFRHFSGPRRHHDDPVGKIHRFIHAVGDEDHRLAFALPQLQEFFL